MDCNFFTEVNRHVFLEPRSRAEFDWFHEFGGISQLMGQIPRAEMETFAAGGGWKHPEREITIELHDPPDWDWWEPRYDAPWRRKALRQGEFDRTHKADPRDRSAA